MFKTEAILVIALTKKKTQNTSVSVLSVQTCTVSKYLIDVGTAWFVLTVCLVYKAASGRGRIRDLYHLEIHSM